MPVSACKFKVKHVLVTGAAGFLGQHVCRYLRQQGVLVRAMLRRPIEGPWDEAVIADLSRPESFPVRMFDDVDSVFHLAAIAHHRATEEDYQHNNVDSCVNIAQAALAAGVTRLIYVSSSKAVAEPYDRCVDENFTDMPTDAYGVSKRRGEEVLLAMPGLTHLVIARPPLIYGAGVRDNLAMMLRWIDKCLFPPLPDLPAPRSMVAAADVARALLLLAQEPKAHQKIYFVTDNQVYQMAAVERAMRTALGRKLPVWHVPFFCFWCVGKTGDLFRKLYVRFPIHSGLVHKLLGPAQYSSEKLQRELGWRPETDFYRELPAIVAEYRRLKQ